MEHKNNFDFLRLVAALFVTFSHSYGWVSPGLQKVHLSKYGLIIFFSISGYLITASLKNSHSIKEFLVKRILRIYPLLILTVILTFIYATFVTILPLKQFLVNKDTLSYLFNFSGLTTRFNLPGIQKSMHGSLWSISVEVRLYLSLVLLSLMQFLTSKKVSIVVLFFTIFYACYAAFTKHYYFCIYGICFWLGSFLYLHGNRYLSFIKKNNYWILIFFILYMVLAILYPGWILMDLFEMIIFSSITLVIGNSKAYFSLHGQDYSYSIYLFSPLVQRLLVSMFSFQHPIFHFLVTLIVLLPCCYLSWNYFEKPFLNAKKKFI